MRHALILAGGSGTRLWPFSTASLPKQLVPMLGGQSLLDIAVARAQSVADEVWLGRPALHPGGRLLAVGMLDGVRFWDLRTGDQVAHVKGLGWNPSVEFTKDGDELVSNGDSGLNVGRVSVDRDSGLCQVAGGPVVDGRKSRFRHAMSDDGTVLAIPSPGGVTVYKRGPTLTSASFGVISSVRVPPRILQIALKVSF